MMKTIAGLPDGVVGVEATGEVTAQDYDTVLVPAVARGLEGREKIRFLYQIDRGFTGFTAGAMWEDVKVGLHQRKDFEKCAVVADAKWILDSVNLFRVLLPCPVKAFRNDQLAKAKAWLLP